MRIVNRDNSYIKDHDERCVADVLCSLDDVKAPKDFEFRVRAGIANGRPVETMRAYTMLKYVMPTALMALTGLSAVVFWNLPDSAIVADIGIPAVTNTFVMQPPADQNLVAQNEQSSVNSAVQSEPYTNLPETGNTSAALPRGPVNVSLRNRSRGSSGPRRPLTAPEPEGGSRDLALTINREVLLPKGINPERTQDGVTRNIPNIDIKSSLEVIGATCQNKNNGWHVSGAKSGSILARSGLRTGDIITAINGRSVIGDALMPAGVITSVIVDRDGSLISLSLR